MNIKSGIRIKCFFINSLYRFRKVIMNCVMVIFYIFYLMQFLFTEIPLSKVVIFFALFLAILGYIGAALEELRDAL